MSQNAAKKELIKHLTDNGGFLSIHDFMAFCLHDETNGYYRCQEPLGRQGDFITAPELSQVFGELIGLWFVNFYETMGKPEKVALLELGPGRGLLLKDILRAFQMRPSLLDSLEIHAVEINPFHQKNQHQAVHPHAIHHHESIEKALETIGDTPTFCVANEFFDSFPVHQYIYTDHAWQKRGVAYDSKKDDFIFTHQPFKHDRDVLQFPFKPDDGTIMEHAPVVERMTRLLARHIQRGRGAGLIIDYGYDKFGFGDTLQGIKNHEKTSVLDGIGTTDLTVHVNFALLQRIIQNVAGSPADANDAVLYDALETQGEFFEKLGIDLRSQRLAHTTQSKAQQEAIKASTERLVDPSHMGSLFKALQFWAT